MEGFDEGSLTRFEGLLDYLQLSVQSGIWGVAYSTQVRNLLYMTDANNFTTWAVLT